MEHLLYTDIGEEEFYPFMKSGYQKTISASYIGYIVQAIVNNFAPLLFLTFQDSYHISLSKITLLVTVNFALQLVVDLLAAGFIDQIGYRTAAVLAHILTAAGLVCLTVLPSLLPDPFTGLLVSVLIYALGGGLLEVVISPIVESCPTENKEKAMSLLHSFYCWGHMGVVLISTVFFAVFGIHNWKIMTLIWALLPAANAVFFMRVPLTPLIPEGEAQIGIGTLLRKKSFWIFMLLMMCAGASEQAVSQWASTFAERGLGVGKTLGDLAGPMLFAGMMGLSRLFYGRYGHKIRLHHFMLCSVLICVFSYLLISLSPWPAVSLIGCGLCGLSVGILWPGTFSDAAASIRGGGTAMFALLALGGDLGCSLGPTVVGLVSGAAGDNLKAGILAAVFFPLLLLVGILYKGRRKDSLS